MPIHLRIGLTVGFLLVLLVACGGGGAANVPTDVYYQTAQPMFSHSPEPEQQTPVTAAFHVLQDKSASQDQRDAAIQTVIPYFPTRSPEQLTQTAKTIESLLNP